ncbi:MAG: hypothetical protein H3C30_03105 [Candidatus Hydrogenedentes bacterium]|nr:hypothetical protein [Candidatus Hydrogenedentota bacterium]
MKPLLWRPLVAAILLCAAGFWMCPPNAPAQENVPGAEQAPAPEQEEAAAPEQEEAAAPEQEAADDTPPAPEAGAAAASGKWFGGSVRTGFDGMWADGGGRDLELNQYVRFQADPPNAERLHLRGAFWTNADLDSPKPDTSILRDLDDTYDQSLLFRVSHLYLDVDDLWNDSTLRVGRQRILEGAAYNRIDGLYFKQRMPLWDWYVFGGSRATYYDQDFDDLATGAGVSLRPFTQTRIALDVFYGNEKRFVGREYSLHGPVAAVLYRLTGEDEAKTVDTATLSLSVHQTINQYLSLFGRFNLVDDEGNELLLSATGWIPAPFDLTYEATYRRQFNSVGDRMSDMTGYYRLMGTYESYDNWYLALHRPITAQIMASLEAEFRNSHAENWTNRDYQRFAASLSGENLFNTAEIDARLGLEHWDASGGEGTWAVVGEVGRDWDKWKLAVGADYQRYEDRVIVYNTPLKWLDMARVWFAPGILQGYNPLLLFFDRYAVEMRENITTIYVRAGWTPAEDHEFGAKVTFEEGDGPDMPVWRLQADYTYRF